MRARPFFRNRRPALACAPFFFLLAGCPAENTAPASMPSAAFAPPTAQATAAQQAQQQQTSQLLAANQHAQQAQTLISRAEDAYKSGVANYNANRLDAARLDFDFAVDIMLASPMDLKNDPQLADAFDNLLSRINSLEMVALKQGNGFSPKTEAAPLDAAIDVTFPSNPALIGKVAEELRTTQSDFPLVINDYVAGWITYFSSSPAGHAHLKRSLERAGKYKDMISKILRDQGVPQDLIYQAVAESGFQPQVLNAKSGAGGMWQFMPFGNYGLTRNGFFDERFDPEKSSIAYAKYMKTLHNQFGDWYLAMAAYDWGPGNVQRVVARTGYADYWELYRHNALPAETKAYVPGIIAAMIMAKNPEKYNLTDLTPDAPVLSDKVTTSYAIDLRLVGDVTGATVSEIVALNPALLRLSTPRDVPYDLHIPPGTLTLYNERLKDIPEDRRTTWRFHIVKTGESLETISAALHAHAADVATLNEVTAAKPLQVDDELVIPLAAASSAAPGQQKYTARRGDTLVTIADRFGITAEQLRRWNPRAARAIKPGTSLFVAEPIRLAPGMHTTRGRGKHTRSTAAHGKRSAASGGRSASPSAAHGKAKSAPARSHATASRKKRAH